MGLANDLMTTRSSDGNWRTRKLHLARRCTSLGFEPYRLFLRTVWSAGPLGFFPHGDVFQGDTSSELPCVLLSLFSSTQL